METFSPDVIPLLTGAAVFAHQGEEKKSAQLALF
jgi:hypothetical protein